MSPATELLRDELLDRRQRLTAVLGSASPAAPEVRFAHLLQQVDAALERLDGGHWGVCVVCHGKVEAGRLEADPLVSVCLGCLTPEQSHDLERDLEAAARVQRALLPERPVRHAGWEIDYLYEPLGAVSGDHIDLLRPAAGPVSLLFGDVSGKGVSASLLQSHLHALFRALGGGELSLPELLERINRLFCEATTASSYATLVALRLHDDGRVELANAGHPAPLLLAAGDVAPVDGTNLPVGLFPEVRFGAREVTLAPGDALVLYTDGWTEAGDPAGREYGVERATAAVAAGARGKVGLTSAELLAACRADVDRHLAGASRRDDLTLLAIRRAA